MTQLGPLGKANAQVHLLWGDNSEGGTCLRTNCSSSSRWEYGASTQFACVFPVIRRETLCSAPPSKKRTVFLAVAPRRYPVSKPRPNEEPVTSATNRSHWPSQFISRANIFCGATLPSASQASSLTKWLVSTSCPRDWRTLRIFLAASIEERLPATVKP